MMVIVVVKVEKVILIVFVTMKGSKWRYGDEAMEIIIMLVVVAGGENEGCEGEGEDGCCG